MKILKNNTLRILSVFMMFCTANMYSQNKNSNQIYREIQDTNKTEMCLMIKFLIDNEPDFSTNTDINYLSEIVYKKSQAFFGLDKLYLEVQYHTEAYLFYATASHSNTYIMLYNENDVLFLGKADFEKDLQLLLMFTEKNINKKDRFEFFKKVSTIFTYMVEWNYRL